MTTRATAPSSPPGSRSTRATVLIKRGYLANETSLEHDRWKRQRPEFCRKTGIT